MTTTWRSPLAAPDKAAHISHQNTARSSGLTRADALPDHRGRYMHLHMHMHHMYLDRPSHALLLSQCLQADVKPVYQTVRTAIYVLVQRHCTWNSERMSALAREAFFRRQVEGGLMTPLSCEIAVRPGSLPSIYPPSYAFFVSQSVGLSPQSVNCTSTHCVWLIDDPRRDDTSHYD